MDVEQLVKDGELEPVPGEPDSFTFYAPIRVSAAAVAAGGFEIFSGGDASTAIALTKLKIQRYVIDVLNGAIAAQVDAAAAAQKRAILSQMIGEAGMRILELEAAPKEGAERMNFGAS